MRRVYPHRGGSRRPMLASTPHNRHRSAWSDDAMPARQPLEMPGRYGFHSTRPARGAPVDRPARCWRTDPRRPSRSRRLIDYMRHLNDAFAPSPNTVLWCEAGGRAMARTVAGPTGSHNNDWTSAETTCSRPRAPSWRCNGRSGCTASARIRTKGQQLNVAGGGRPHGTRRPHGTL